MRRSLALCALLALAAPLLAVPTVSAAPAAPMQTVTPFAGHGAANLLEVDASLAGTDIVDVDLTPADTAVDTGATPRSTGRAANLDATLLGELSLDDILSVAEQSAPPDNEDPEEAVLIPVDADPLLNLDVSTARTHARWPGDGECLAVGEPIVESFTETASADVLAVPGLGGSLVTVVNETGGATGTHSAITTEAVDGQSGRALQSESTTQIDAVSLFQGTPLEFSVEIASAPTLTATATGAPGGASVDFNAPVVNVTSPEGSAIPEIPLVNLVPVDELGGLIDQLTDGLEEAVQATLGDAGVVDVNIILGEETLQSTVAPDGTGAAATAAAAIIEIEVLGVLGEALVDATIAVAPLEASAAVPAGGIDCGQPDNPLELHKDVSQADVAPGATFDYTLSVFNQGPCTLTDVVVTDVITGPDGTTVTADPAPASNDNETLTWNIDEIAPGGTATFTLTVAVPEGATHVGTTYQDVLTASAQCGDETVERTVTLDQPSVTDDFAGPCDLALSNKSSSHRQVVPGQTFNYFVHVFNNGDEPCDDITVGDVLDDRVEFVACSDGCTNEGQEVTWTGESVAGGGGKTLTVTVRVRDDATGRLANAAFIDSPDDEGGPVAVGHDGPEVSTVSELLPPDPPSISPIDSSAPPPPAANGPLPRTGTDVPAGLAIALGMAGLLGLAVASRRRSFLG